MMRPGLLISLFILSALPLISAAQSTVTLPADSYTPLPGGLGEFVGKFYTTALTFGGILAFAVLMFAAAEYTISGGNPSKQSDARDRIEQALLGLLLLLGAYIVLNVINPELVNIQLGQLKKIKTVDPRFLTSSEGTSGGPCRTTNPPCDPGLTCSRGGICTIVAGAEGGACRPGPSFCNAGLICDGRGICSRPPDSPGVSSSCLSGPANAQYVKCFAGDTNCDGRGECSSGATCQSFTNPNCQ